MKETTAREVAGATRFGLFAASHILWSLGCSLFGLRLLNQVPAFLFAAAGMMLAYLPLGWITAKLAHWPKPDRKQSLWVVFLPALIAWAWAGTTAACLYLIPEGVGVGAALGLPAFLLAVPSMLLTFVVMGVTRSVLGGVSIVLGIFLAGLLPSLLFWLGSWLGKAGEMAVLHEACGESSVNE